MQCFSLKVYYREVPFSIRSIFVTKSGRSIPIQNFVEYSLSRLSPFSSNLELFLCRTYLQSLSTWKDRCWNQVPPADLSWGRSSGVEINSSFRLACLNRRILHASPGGTPYNYLYGEASAERATFFRLQVYYRVRISLAEV